MLQGRHVTTSFLSGDLLGGRRSATGSEFRSGVFPGGPATTTWFHVPTLVPESGFMSSGKDDTGAGLARRRGRPHADVQARVRWLARLELASAQSKRATRARRSVRFWGAPELDRY